MFGASFSAKYARELGIDPKLCLQSALRDLKIRRLRLMSYWDVHEKTQGKYDFTELDWQFKLAGQYGAEVSLSIGLRQPRWPESHWPKWAKEMPEEEWREAIYRYIEVVVKRYKDHPALASWQLENEARLKSFGLNGDFDRSRLRREFKLMKKIDPNNPVIMTCSDSWGMPFFGPKPDIYGFSVYRYFYDRGRYRHSTRPAIFYRLRTLFIRILKGRPAFIHELQAEPWGPKPTSKLSLKEQYESMDLRRVKEAVEFAQRSKLLPVDLWGLEWWHYLKTEHKQDRIWQYMRKIYSESL